MMVERFVTLPSAKPLAPAAGRFGIDAGRGDEMRAYRPAGCPSMEQFAARFRLANDRDGSPRAA
jgi:hypothetical protein